MTSNFFFAAAATTTMYTKNFKKLTQPIPHKQVHRQAVTHQSSSLGGRNILSFSAFSIEGEQIITRKKFKRGVELQIEQLRKDHYQVFIITAED